MQRFEIVNGVVELDGVSTETAKDSEEDKAEDGML